MKGHTHLCLQEKRSSPFLFPGQPHNLVPSAQFMLPPDCYDNRFISIVPVLPPSSSTSKSRTSNLVSSVPLRLPTAHTSFVLLQRMRQTTPPLLPLSRATRLRRNSPVRKSQIFTVPSSLDVITNVLLNWRQVTALWCLFGPVKGHNTNQHFSNKPVGYVCIKRTNLFSSFNINGKFSTFLPYINIWPLFY